MVGEKGKNMTYSVAVTSAGQMTIPKAIREALGIVDRVVVDRKGDKVIIERERTTEEILEEAHKALTPAMRRRAKRIGAKTASELREDILNSKEWAKYVKEKYGVKPCIDRH